MTERCHCGRALHYKHKFQQEQVEDIIRQFGSFIDVKQNGRTFRVQRHYIALHGLTGKDLPNLGFKEVTDEVRKT